MQEIMPRAPLALLTLTLLGNSVGNPAIGELQDPSTPKPDGAPSEETTRALSLHQSIELALENNLDLRIQQQSPEIAAYNLRASYGAYDPTFDFAAEESFVSSPGGVNPDTNEPFPASETRTDRYSMGIGGQLPITGMRYDLSANAFRRTGNFIGATEKYTGGASASVTQPLLRDFWIDATRRQIQVNQKNLEISELELSDRVIQTITEVEQAYYDLVFAHENLAVQEMALELAERLLAENRKRVEVGTIPPLDVKQAESQVATRRADLLEARQTADTRENALKNLITSDYSDWHPVELNPTETLTAARADFGLQESWNQGLLHRPDLRARRRQLERQDIILKYDYNQLFPALDLTASVGVNGLDGTFDGLINDYTRADNPRHAVGVIFSMPLGNRNARNRHQASKAEKEQLLLQLKQEEQQVMIDIDNALKQLETNFQRVEATREAREFAETALQAEQEKLEAGESTSFEVLRLQRDLTAARSAEIRALADYNISLAELARAKGTTLERHEIDLEIFPHEP